MSCSGKRLFFRNPPWIGISRQKQWRKADAAAPSFSTYQKPGIPDKLFISMKSRNVFFLQMQSSSFLKEAHYILDQVLPWKSIHLKGIDWGMKAAREFLGHLLASVCGSSYPSCGFHSLHVGIFCQLSFMAGSEGFSGGLLCWSPRMSLQAPRGKIWTSLKKASTVVSFAFIHLLSVFALLPSLVKWQWLRRA